MKTVKMMLCAAALAAVGTLAAQEQTLNKASDWNKSPAIADGDGVLTVSKATLMIGKMFEVDPAKTYTIKCSVQAKDLKGTDKSWVLVGFQAFDKNNAEISCQSVNVIPAAITEVAADAAKGAKSLIVKDGSKFRKSTSAAIVADAKADFSDLPNRNIVFRGAIDAITQKDGAWEITLKQPLLKDVKAGTTIREHGMGGYLYTAGSAQVGSSPVTMSGSISGVSTKGWNSKVWPVGTVKARPLILANWSRKDLVTEFKDITLTVK